MSFKGITNAIKNPEFIRQRVGNYSYVAFALVLIMQFSAKIGVAGMPIMFIGEVFPFKWVFWFLKISVAFKNFGRELCNFDDIFCAFEFF